jgi:hypothetical protein
MVFFILVMSLVFGGCTSLGEGAGRLLDGSAWGEKTLARYRTERGKAGPAVEVREVRGKDGRIRLDLRPAAVPTLVITASAPEEGEFYLRSFSFLCSNPTGWNEFERDLAGSGFFRTSGGRGMLRLEEPLEVLDITGGKIRRKNTLLIDGEALQALRNRDERIRALSDWMHGQEGPGDFASLRGFTRYWKPILFPELAPPWRRPPAWAEQPPVWASAGDLRWNQAYTDACFPGELREIRNSGTLLRDWEEAAAWVYLEYRWNDIIASLGDAIQLIRTK